eukprot:TRINITY_DN33011_c0_g1_i1.p1 TRINITY_DN33011_c0_g1~~TRINITY_DN33011_c0_g1_i1.p1  ORF type:complete len:232 (-),score=16.67 TRINITY_DN33011_c0_g1_i1:95-790(-)
MSKIFTFPSSPSLLLFLAALLLLRIIIVIRSVGRRSAKRHRSNGKANVSTLLVLGSGGHTAEMLNLVNVLNLRRYSPRTYIAAATDNMSLPRARTLEEKLAAEGKIDKNAPGTRYLQIYRSREVGQSYVTSVGTTLLATAHAFGLVFAIRPELILCNGPGTCLPLAVAGFVLRILGVRDVKLAYVESVARVQKLSLTGSLLYKLGIVDQFFVQWPQLTDKYPGLQYVGRLM